MGMPDPNKPYTDEQKAWLHAWGLDWKIEVNERRFAQAALHNEGKPIDVAKVLEDAGVQIPAPSNNPVVVSVTAPVEEPFDEDAVRAELADYTVAELKSELKEMGESTDGNKAELIDTLVEALRKDAE